MANQSRGAIMNVVLSTRNQSKLHQARAVFEGSPISVVSLDEADIHGQGVENGITLEENALKKACFVHEQSPGVWAMSDDAGIFIDALNGNPGVNTADWNGGNTDTAQRTLWILDQLKDAVDRSATFRTVVAIVAPDGNQHLFSGEVRGKILPKPREGSQPKMPYAPIFVPDGTDKTWGEMTTKEENEISHRGQAFRKAREFLESV